ncbi:MAG: FAD-dependent oxidoreductase, partial [Chloroflexota bacterium]
MSKKVIIIGGGIAGLSAAHELAERNQNDEFEIHIYEAHPDIPGGKARSLPVPDSGREGRFDLPAEHGFRIFLGCYHHLDDTMKRIPYGRGSTFDNLVDTTRLLIGRFDTPTFVTIAKYPRSFRDFRQVWEAVFDLDESGLTLDDVEFFSRKLWQFATSCQERRLAEYEKMTWWRFIEADTRSLAYQNLLGNGISRSVTANNPHIGNAKTMGDICLQIFFSVINPTVPATRVLNGPTNEVWLDPWKTYLEALGVTYTFNATVESIQYAEERIQSVGINVGDGESLKVSGDYFIFALPVEVMGKLLTNMGPQSSNPMLHADASLSGIIELQRDVAWMNGLFFFLTEDVPVTHGHQLYTESPWAVTGISQLQFWGGAGFDISYYGDGQVKGILSTIISNWDTPGLLHKKPAKACTPQEIKEEVWEQMKRCLNIEGQAPILTDDLLHSWFLAPSIQPNT